MVTLVFGDIHGRTIWKDIVKKEKYDKVIFLGDYVTTHELISDEQQLSNFVDILNFKKDNSDRVILLRGNHDLWNFSWGHCTPFPSNNLLSSLKPLFNDFSNLSQWIYIKDNILFSHAGVSQVWLDNNNLKIEDINDKGWYELFGFTPNNWSDCSGTSTSQPPTWIRPQSLVKCSVKDYIQVVGHSGVKSIISLKDINQSFSDIWLCDNLPNQYLIIKDDKFIVKDI